MSIFKQYFLLCWLKAEPLALPQSSSFFKQNLIFYFMLESFIQVNMTDDFSSLFDVILEISLTFGFVALILSLNKTMGAFIQIATAVLFCENMVSIFMVPVVFWMTVSYDLASYALLSIFILWDFTLIAYVFKRVLGINAAAGFVVSLFYFIVTYGGAYGLSGMFI